ncbi:MAG: flagellin FliC3 [Butyrivibrio sp.]|nr:flagellin FliC3 [Butyrivibrio sp.]
MKVNCNVSAMIANNALTRNDNLLSESLKRLSSGLKIANAKDNPSGLAMSRRMNAQIEGLSVANDTSNDAISIVQVADGSLAEIHDVLQRMNELAIKAANGTLIDEDRATIQAEVSQLKQEIERMANTTQFNGQNILDGSFDLKGYATVGTADTGKTDPDVTLLSYSDNISSGRYEISGIDVTYENTTGPNGDDRKEIKLNSENVQIKRILESGSRVSYMDGASATVREDILVLTDATGKKIELQIDKSLGGDTVSLELTGLGPMTMQIGANEGQTLDIRIEQISLTTLGIYNVDVSTQSRTGNCIGAQESIESIKNAITRISDIRSRLGAYQNRLEHTVKSLDVTEENMTAAYSRIMDVDMAEEMTTYSTQQVLSQAGISMMAQANERPSQVLQLLQ